MRDHSIELRGRPIGIKNSIVPTNQALPMDPQRSQHHSHHHSNQAHRTALQPHDALKVLDIPELLGSICVHLSSNDLVQCSHVNKTWNQLFCPYIWSHISIKTATQLNRFVRENKQAHDTHVLRRTSLVRYARHIRSIYTAFYAILPLFLEESVSCAALTKLEFPANTRFPTGKLSAEELRKRKLALERLDVTSRPPGLTSEADTLESVSPTYIAKRRLFTDLRGVSSSHPEFDETVLYHIMDKSPRLESLVFSSFPFYYGRMMIVVADRLSGLKRLDLTNLHNCPVKAQSIYYLLQHCAAGLEELKVSISPGSKAESFQTDSFKELVPSKMLGLRRLELLGNLGGGGDLPWIPLLRSCNQLQELHLDLFSKPELNLLADYLYRHCAFLQRLTLRCFAGPQDEQDLANLVRINPSTTLRQLTMKFFHGFGPLVTDALSRHMPTLESLIFEECDGISSKDIQLLLGSCPQLSVFEAMTANGRVFSSTVFLDVEDMLSGPWACEATLESLKLVISGIPRPDLTRDQYGQALSGPLHTFSDRGNYECQKAVYKRLGALFNLEVLWLGHDSQDLDDEENYHFVEELGLWRFIDPDYQFECLEFSLASGLAQLEGLKKLRRLNLDRVMTRIGQSEVQWMSRQWPRLKYIMGLVVQGEKESKAVQWVYDHRPDIELPPIMGSFNRAGT
ncbi:hypothetical protein BG004_004541 [Podila humilis]|nr:hypothetical protein BG004_004541 [Podila humilis]